MILICKIFKIWNVLYEIQIIGEACYFLTKTFKETHTQIEWHKIERTRHILVHHYDAVNEETVWRIATTYVPQLLLHIQPLIESHKAEGK